MQKIKHKKVSHANVYEKNFAQITQWTKNKTGMKAKVVQYATG